MFEVREIVDRKVEGGVYLYKILWKGYPDE